MLAQCVSEVVSGRASHGVAIVRPPGHHAEGGKACGFCVVNNVAVAARHAREELGVQRCGVCG